MKTLISAFFATLVLCGSSGCGRLCCRPLFPFLHHACTNGCSQGCEATGIFNWSHCCDTCDQCANWTGDDIVAQTGDDYQPQFATTPTRPTRHHHAKRARPGAYHVTSRMEHPFTEETEIVESTDETIDADQLVDDSDESDEVAAKPVTTRRVRSSKPRGR